MHKSLGAKIKSAIRKWMSAKIVPYLIFNSWRIFFYRLCGYRIGKNVFIGMRCYLDDLEPKMFTVEDNVTISYGVFFACHGKNQGHYPITVKEGAYIGMRANIISKNAEGGKDGVTIGKNAIVGACALVNRNVPDGATAVGIPCKIIEK
ncbi:MAG: acyltransferase [Oscillospiraceae bacterium]|nr:acyltransferase [Candidatus Equicaccousia limihippi]